MIHAKYTVVLKTLMDSPVVKPAIELALSKYPLYKPDGKYDLVPEREEINTRLLNHYKYREIGFETVGRFLDELEITMNEIMPRYNELFKTVVTMADLPSPFDNVDVVETFDEERTTEANSDTTTTNITTMDNSADSNNKHVRTTTPQSDISIPADALENVEHADEVTWGKDHSSTTGISESESGVTGSSNGTEKVTHTHTKKGNQGVNTYAHDMLEFRTAIIDVVDQIIRDPRINELFMLVY